MLKIESGLGDSDSESYVSVLDSQAYFDAFGEVEAWELATEAQKEAALRNATQWVDVQVRWYSTRLVDDQALLWPRVPFYDKYGVLVEGIPKLLKQATASAAALHLGSSLFSTSTSAIKSESYGDTSVTYAGQSVSVFTTTQDSILDLLQRYGANSVHIIETFRA